MLLVPAGARATANSLSPTAVVVFFLIHQLVVSTTPISQDIVSATIKGLKAGSTNYARLYTKGPLGTEYGPVVSFVTSGGSPSSDDNPTPGY